MGLSDALKKRPAEPAQLARPPRIDAAAASGILCSPVAGKVIAMADVPDPVFSGEILGKGCAIWPEGDVVYAPVSGTVSASMGHAVGITSDDGAEVIVHVGVDTVNLQGKGFTGYVARDERVEAGQPVLKMDRKVISDAGYKDCVVLAVVNAPAFASVDLAVGPGAHVEAGVPVITVSRA